MLKQDHVRPALVLEALAELAVRVPTVPVVFAETRKLAQEWSYRFLGAALAHLVEEASAVDPLLALPSAGGPLAPSPTTGPATAAIREWVQQQRDRGRRPRTDRR